MKKQLLQFSSLQHPVLYCILGALAVCVPSLRNDGWGLVLLIVFITLYGWLSKDGTKSTRAEVGDNCYFIGFVYTLLVITAALFFDAVKIVGETATKEALAPLLKTIGIALGTSVYGMIWRFGLAHEMETPENEFDRITNKIAIAADKLSGTVGHIEREAKKFATSLASYSESIRAHSNMLVSETGKIGINLEKEVEKLMQSLNKQISVMWERIEFEELSAALKKIIDDHQAGMIEISETQETALEHLREAVSVSIRGIEHMQNTTESLRDGVNKNLTGIGQVVHRLDSNVGKLTDSLKPLEDVQKTLVENNLEHINAIQEKFDAAINNLLSGLSSIRNIVEETHNKNPVNDLATRPEQNATQDFSQEPAITTPFYFRLILVLELIAIVIIMVALYLGPFNEPTAGIKNLEGFPRDVQTTAVMNTGGQT